MWQLLRVIFNAPPSANTFLNISQRHLLYLTSFPKMDQNGRIYLPSQHQTGLVEN